MDEKKSATNPNKLKKIGLIAVVVIAVLIGVFYAFSAYSDMANDVDTAVEHIMTEDSGMVDLDDWWVDDYMERKDSKRFSKKLNEAIAALPAQEDLQPGHVGRVVKNLETLGYHNESTKAVIDAVYAETKPQFLADKPVYFIKSLRLIANTAYYSNAESIMPADEIISMYADEKKTALNSNDIEDLTDYMKDVQDILEACPYVSGEDFISPEEILNIVTPLTEPTIFRDGAGGYYDTNDRNSYSSHKDSLHYTHSTSYNFYGDFMIKHTSKRALRTTNGEKWEEDLLKKYDSSSSTLYYKGESLNISTKTFQTLLGGGTLMTKPATSTANGGSGDTAVAVDTMPGAETGNVLAVLVSMEEDHEILCFVKEDGIAFLDPRATEVSFKHVSTEGFDLTVAQPEHFIIPIVEKDTGKKDGGALVDGLVASQTYTQMCDIINDSFKDHGPTVVYDKENQRMIMLVTAPSGTSGNLAESGGSSDSWTQFCTSLTDMAKAGKDTLAEAGFPDSFAAAVISDADDSVILFATIDGKPATAEFAASAAE